LYSESGDSIQSLANNCEEEKMPKHQDNKRSHGDKKPNFHKKRDNDKKPSFHKKKDGDKKPFHKKENGSKEFKKGGKPEFKKPASIKGMNKLLTNKFPEKDEGSANKKRKFENTESSDKQENKKFKKQQGSKGDSKDGQHQPKNKKVAATSRKPYFQLVSYLKSCSFFPF
jgi:hypothetical protein